MRALLMLLALLPTLALAGGDGLPTMQNVDAAMRGPGEELTVRMELQSGTGAVEVRSLQMWTLAPAGKPKRSLIRFQSPSTIAGTALLSVSRGPGLDDTWAWVPAQRQVRRIAAQDRTTPFVGSDFTVEDLSVAVDPSRRIYTLEGEGPCGETTCLLVADRPKDEKAKGESGYGWVVLHVDKVRFVVHRVDFYDKGGALLKVLRAEGLVPVGDRWRFDKATMANVQKGTKTTFVVQGRKAGSVDEGLFSPTALGEL
jgi:hypothetical protein